MQLWPLRLRALVAHIGRVRKVYHHLSALFFSMSPRPFILRPFVNSFLFGPDSLFRVRKLYRHLSAFFLYFLPRPFILLSTPVRSIPMTFFFFCSVLVYSCPEKSPVRLKMTYSSSKASVVAAAAEDGAAVDHMVNACFYCCRCGLFNEGWLRSCLQWSPLRCIRIPYGKNTI